MTLDALARSLAARAAGLWLAGPSALEQVEFWGADDLPPEVADGFAAATRRVPLDRPDFGIVGAAVDGVPRVSVAAELPPGSGSAVWLGRFGADRSIAVPHARAGRVVAVASVAVLGAGDDARAILRLRSFLASRLEGDGGGGE